MTSSVCRNLISVGQLDERSIPSFNVGVGFPKDVGDNVCRLLRIEGRSRVAIRNQLWIIASAAGARGQETACSQDPLRFGYGDPGILEVVEHPEHRHGADTVISQWEVDRVSSDGGSIGTAGDLARRGIQSNPIQSTVQGGCESSDATADIEHGIYILDNEPVGDWRMNVFLPARSERPRSDGVVVIVRVES